MFPFVCSHTSSNSKTPDRVRVPTPRYASVHMEPPRTQQRNILSQILLACGGFRVPSDCLAGRGCWYYDCCALCLSPLTFFLPAKTILQFIVVTSESRLMFSSHRSLKMDVYAHLFSCFLEALFQTFTSKCNGSEEPVRMKHFRNHFVKNNILVIKLCISTTCITIHLKRLV